MPNSSRDVIVRTADLAAAERYYGTMLGFAVCHRGPGILGFETGAFRLYVEFGPAHGPVFELLVADVEATRTRLLDAGCVLVEEDRGGPRCYLRDPYGVTYNIGRTPAP